VRRGRPIDERLQQVLETISDKLKSEADIALCLNLTLIPSCGLCSEYSPVGRKTSSLRINSLVGSLGFLVA
jgi:hypothetical protein